MKRFEKTAALAVALALAIQPAAIMAESIRVCSHKLTIADFCEIIEVWKLHKNNTNESKNTCRVSAGM